ncbi:related to allantoate permease [Cephalotrichum gorgonifer]|uniref:Related to allantoate permease n=1 Tax=Cephalotrichum gorgonifer TaxID=2041049 RepID=A0AAE8MQN3_9PEZI|nr:related to allantoate permease [Cephalotrichum gorgonifer]
MDTHVEDKASSTLSGDVPAPAQGNTDAEAARDKKLVKKLDWKILPWLCFLYLLAFLDRTNIGNAKIAGLSEDLGLSTYQYNATLTIFFVSYAVFEPVTNVLLKSIRPSTFIPIIVVLWGFCMMSMGFVTNWSGLMAARWFLGLTEAGLFPGINYYLSCWYKRSELGVRAAIFFSAAAASGSFGGLLAAAISLMENVGGRPGWAWIFILEGILTIVAGFLSFYMVLDFPHETKALSEVERAQVIRRLAADNPLLEGSTENETKYKSSYLIDAIRDWKTWLSMVIYMGCDMPLYAFSLFLPSIINDLDLGLEDLPTAGNGISSSTVRSQLLSAAPYVTAAIITVVVGYVADRTSRRGIYNLVFGTVAAAGFSMLLGSEDPAVQYAGTFLAALGIYPCISNTISWVANNTEGVYKRGIVLGFTIGWGNLTGIVSSNIYYKPPNFIEGHAIVLGFLAAFLVGGSFVMMVFLEKQNKKRSSGRMDHVLEGKTDQEAADMGDMHPRFVYTL